MLEERILNNSFNSFFSAVDVNNLAFTTIGIFDHGSIVSISNFALYNLGKAIALTFFPTTILILAISRSD